MIACVRRANENAGNLISVVQFLIKLSSQKSGKIGLQVWKIKLKSQAIIRRTLEAYIGVTIKLNVKSMSGFVIALTERVPRMDWSDLFSRDDANVSDFEGCNW